MLLENNVNINKNCGNGTTPLLMAAQNGRYDRRYLKTMQISMKKGEMQSYQNCHTDICTVLLENNVNVSNKRGNGNVCTVLLENNGNVNKKWPNSATPLFMAVQNGHSHVGTVYVLITM